MNHSSLIETWQRASQWRNLPLRRHGDRLQRLPSGKFRACGRLDDATNASGIKVGSAELETIINGDAALMNRQ